MPNNNSKLIDEEINACDRQGNRTKINRIFFFDESNNIKKAIIGKEKDNNFDLQNLYFALGGIALDKKLNFDDLLKYIGARQTPNDAKFSFFAFKKNKFEEAIAQSRLRKFFEYLLKENIIIHFHIFSYFHFALIDILDSLIEEEDANQQAAFMFYPYLQSDMTEVLFMSYDDFHDLLVDYEFPNVPKEKVNSFINKILDMYTKNLAYFDLNDEKNFTKELLRQIIKSKRDKNNLIFLEGNEKLVISSDIFMLYLTRMIEFKDKKYFDNESSIMRNLQNIDPNYKEKLTVDFLDSKDHREIQICDVICGFVARLYNYLSHHSDNEIIDFCNSLHKEDESFKTLRAFFELMDISDAVSSICFKKTAPFYINKRFDIMFKLISGK